jgi:hypothetical protein
MKTRFAILAALVVSAILLWKGSEPSHAAFGNEISPRTGKTCVVQFRRDALGAAANLPIAPMTDSINGAATSVSGKLKAVTSEWIVLEDGGQEIWIQRASVLLLRY